MSKPTRAVKLGRPEMRFTHQTDGTILVESPEPLGPYPARLTERLLHWAETAPNRVFMAQRDADDVWQSITYGETLTKIRAIGQFLLDRALSPERPVVILSGNDLEHALLGLACLHVGIPYAPLSVPYSTVSTDFERLRHIVDLLQPGLVFAADAALFGRAIAAVVSEDTDIVLTRGAIPGRRHTPFADLLAIQATEAVDAAFARVGPDTIAKFLFTSGSTGLPKGVINTQLMLCSNQQMLLEALPFMADTPPVILDWLPWNHTFGGNHNFGLVLYNGGSMYLDDGAPTAAGMARSVRNLREIAPTVFFNVPKGYEELVAYLRREPALRERFFSRLELMFYASAGLAQHVWDELDELGIATTGERVVMLTGLGATETAPFALVCRPEVTGSGIVGLPVPGMSLKLVPEGDRLEARVRGPNITPGYWRNKAQTEAAFDDEGFYKFGDALKFVDPDDPDKGFRFDGRISENFKLATGTWVHVGALRARAVAAFAPYARDVVVAGHDQDDVAVLVVPDPPACEGLRGAALLARLRPLLNAFAATGTGSASRVVRAALLEAPLSIDRGEITDKGSLNQRAVLKSQAALVADLYVDPPPAHVLVAAAIPFPPRLDGALRMAPK
jgi:feruloyl-CoA synthase